MHILVYRYRKIYIRSIHHGIDFGLSKPIAVGDIVEAVMERLEKVEKELAMLQAAKGEKPEPEAAAGKDEIVEILKEKHGGRADRIVCVTTLQKRPDLPTGWNFWSYLSAWARGAVKIDVAKVSTLMEACGNEMRLRILYEIYKSAKYPKELTVITGLSGGSLYHHLDILTETNLITRDKLGKAMLTCDGEHLADMIFTAMADIAGGRDTKHGENPDWAIVREDGGNPAQSEAPQSL